MQPSPGTTARLMRRPAAPRVSDRVLVYPSPDGTVRLIGRTSDGRFVAEYVCLAEDFDERAVTRMERAVLRKEARHGLTVVR